MTKTKFSITITPRSIIGKRGKVYDAQTYYHGERFSVSEKSRKEATAALLQDLEYVRTSIATYGAGFFLFATGFECWYFRFPHGGGMAFKAADIAAAQARVFEDYKDHDTAKHFFVNNTPVCGDDFYRTKDARFKAAREAWKEQKAG